MTNKEATDVLNAMRNQKSKLEDNAILEAVNLAIEALEKQIPKEPDVWGDGDADGAPVYDMWDCPDCGKTYEVDGEKHDFCPNCGQAVNWSEYE